MKNYLDFHHFSRIGKILNQKIKNANKFLIKKINKIRIQEH